MVRIGLRTLLEEDEDILVVGEAATSATAVAEAARLKPDVVLMDVRLPDASGAEACTDIRSKSLRTRGVSARILGHVSSRW
jgi:DNA-binding NarL/FixJ family response regulator